MRASWTTVVAAAVALGAPAADVQIVADGQAWSVQTEAYHARLKDNGCLAALERGQASFLATEGGSIGHAFYFCKDGFWGPGPLQSLDACTLAAENSRAGLRYEFGLDGFTCTATNKEDTPLILYMIMNPDLETVRVADGRILRPPATETTTGTVWRRGAEALEVRGSNRIWGPWKDHQVWEIKLAGRESRTVRFTPRPLTEADTVSPPPPPSPRFDTSGNGTVPPQVALCMIGDSITWWNHGDEWRRCLLEALPVLAFVGTHTARLGYSHAGEGGNSVDRVLARLDDIPDCAYYHVLIGTNNNSVATADLVQPQAAKTAALIEKVVNGLLAKPSVRKVFLGSVLPCFTKNPLRDRTNAATNVVLRERLAAGAFPAGRVVWVEYEHPVRATPGWEQKIELHPTPEGYRLLADVLAPAIRRELGLAETPQAPVPKPGSGVRVHNLWDAAAGRTAIPLIAGMYTLSFEVVRQDGPDARVVVCSADPDTKPFFRQEFPLPEAATGVRRAETFYTREEGYSYARCVMTVQAQGCEVRQIMIEKMRPSRQPSAPGQGIYLDTTTPPAPGELVELP